MVEQSEIDQLLQKPEQRDAQKKLAAEIVALVHGDDALKQVISETRALFKTPIEQVVQMTSEAEFLTHFKNTEILQIPLDQGLSLSGLI